MGLALLAAIASAHAAVSLYPWHWDPPRRVGNGAVRTDGAISFPEDGVVTIPDHAVSIPRTLDTGAVVVEVVATSAGPQDGPARILSLSDGIRSQSLMIGQSGDSLVVRVRRSGSSDVGRPGFVDPGLFAAPGPHRIEVAVTADEIAVSVDGAPIARETQAGDPVGSWSPTHHLVLGNEHGGTRGWLGQLNDATLVTPTRRTDLLATGRMPGNYWRLPDRWDAADPVYDPWEPQPVQVLHAAPLLAIGLAAGLSRSRWRPWNVLAGCWALSTVVFLAKFLAGGRHPSLADLLVECTAAAVGLVAGTLVARRRV